MLNLYAVKVWRPGEPHYSETIKAFPGRASVAVTGEAGLGYMLGNLEVLLREKLGITVVHSSNGGFPGYGPSFWGPGHDPFTHQVLGPTRWICRR